MPADVLSFIGLRLLGWGREVFIRHSQDARRRIQSAQWHVQANASGFSCIYWVQFTAERSGNRLQLRSVVVKTARYLSPACMGSITTHPPIKRVRAQTVPEINMRRTWSMWPYYYRGCTVLNAVCWVWSATRLRLNPFTPCQAPGPETMMSGCQIELLLENWGGSACIIGSFVLDLKLELHIPMFKQHVKTCPMRKV